MDHSSYLDYAKTETSIAAAVRAGVEAGGAGGGDLRGGVVVIGMVEEVCRCDFEARADAFGDGNAFEEADVDDGRGRGFRWCALGSNLPPMRLA